jgi:predicted component of type VI protein secretion system
MAEAAQIRVQDAVTQMINDLDKETLRRMQVSYERATRKNCTAKKKGWEWDSYLAQPTNKRYQPID